MATKGRAINSPQGRLKTSLRCQSSRQAKHTPESETYNGNDVCRASHVFPAICTRSAYREEIPITVALIPARITPFVPQISKLTAVVLILHLAVAWAQTTTGTLVGTVSDPNGGPLAGVSVTAIERDTNYRRVTTTNDSGNYSISNLPAGVYHLEFQHAGFKVMEIKEVEVRANANIRSNMQMQVGPLEETITVQAEPIGLQTDNSSISGTINQDQLQQLLLNGRQLERLALLFPNTVTAAPNSHLSNRGGFNVIGLDEHYHSSFVDGIDNVDPVIRNFSYRPVIDAIREIKIEQSGYSAEFGRNGGAVISVSTRPGTNDLHVSFWEFWRSENLDARNFFVPHDFDKPPLLRNQFGATLGGPLKFDRTFFFLAVEGLLQKTGQVRRATVPTDRMRSGDLGEIGGPVILPSQFHPVSERSWPPIPVPISRGLPGIGSRSPTRSKTDTTSQCGSITGCLIATI